MMSRFKQSAEEVQLRDLSKQLERYQSVTYGLSNLLRIEVTDKKSRQLLSRHEELVDPSISLEELQDNYELLRDRLERVGSVHTIQLIGARAIDSEIEQVETRIDALFNTIP